MKVLIEVINTAKRDDNDDFLRIYKEFHELTDIAVIPYSGLNGEWATIREAYRKVDGEFKEIPQFIFAVSTSKDLIAIYDKERNNVIVEELVLTEEERGIIEIAKDYENILV